MPPVHSSLDVRQGKDLDRRRFLQLGAGGLVLIGGGVVAGTQLIGPQASRSPESALQTSRSNGTTVRHELRAAPATLDLGGRTVQTWAYNGTVPGPEIRVTAGDELRIRLFNDLPSPTTVHWHGIALPTDMDGVPGLSQDEVVPGDSFDYQFVVPHPGTYWFHPHVGVQLDTGLQAPLIVEDPAESGQYDEEFVLMLDDWTDGWGDSPEMILREMARNGMNSDGMSMGDGDVSMGGMPSDDQPLGEDAGDVTYPTHLINGRPPADPATISSAPGRRIRFRIINAGADTAYRVAVGGHRLTVTHTDGFGVTPLEVDALIIGMGERYDVVVTAGDGTFPIVAVPEGKDAAPARAVLRTSSGRSSPADARPKELDGRLLRYADLTPTEAAALSPKAPDRELEVSLEMANGGRSWLINGTEYGSHEPLEVSTNERVRLLLRNESMMFHPMHIHGHTFALAGRPEPGIRKDTVNVLPMQTLAVDLQADNPGQWAVHCHNIYHAELGMMTALSYVD